MTTVSSLCKTPSKLILSGEHSVVYGAPALCMAIDLPTYCQLQQSEQRFEEEAVFEIELQDFNLRFQLSFPEWRDQAIQLEAKYKSFSQGNLAIENVLSRPQDLIICTLFHFNQRHKIKLRHWQLKIHSHGLIGKGLGSSASVIISLLHSLYLHHQIEIDETELLETARQIECRQHGQSSGLDTTAVFLGGLILFQKGQVKKRLMISPFQGILLDSGTPINTTGQVVSAVKRWTQEQTKDNPDTPDIWQDFSETTQQIEKALETNNPKQLLSAIRHNQTLLETIGVVPPKIQEQLQSVNRQPNCAAKICGAGSLAGDAAGMVLLLGDCQTPCYFQAYPFELNLTGSHCEFISA